MFPTLGHLFNYLFGTDIIFPLPTYGFMLVMAFSTALLVIRHELKRREKVGLLQSHIEEVKEGGPMNYLDLALTCLFSFAFGGKIIGIVIDYPEFTQDIHAYIFSMKGSLIGGILSLIVFGGMHYWKERKKVTPEVKIVKKEVHPYEIAINIVLMAALFGISGAKIFDILEDPKPFFNDPIGQLLSAGGFTFYGGLIMGIIGVMWYCKRKKIDLLQMTEVGAPAILIAYAVGRMACMLSGDGCWGIPNPEPQPDWLVWLPEWLWAYDFPHNVINEGVPIHNCTGDYCYQLDVPVFPTPLYESFLNLLGFSLLWSLRKKIAAPGILFSMMFIINGFIRFFIEKIRVNKTYEIFSNNITQAEIISSLLIILGISGVIFFYLRHKKRSS